MGKTGGRCTPVFPYQSFVTTKRKMFDDFINTFIGSF